jgi:hypothetical protein
MEFGGGRSFSQELAHFLEVQSSANGWSIIFAHLACDELPELMRTLIAAILAWRIHCDASSLATLDGGDIIDTAHPLPGGEKNILLAALGADETIKQLMGIVLVNIDARAMVPVLATALTVNHHTMIIGTTADTVFSTIIATGVGGSCVDWVGCLAGTLRVRSGGLSC